MPLLPTAASCMWLPSRRSILRRPVQTGAKRTDVHEVDGDGRAAGEVVVFGWGRRSGSGRGGAVGRRAPRARPAGPRDSRDQGSGAGIALVRAVRGRRAGRGVVAKPLDGVYEPDKRSWSGGPEGSHLRAPTERNVTSGRPPTRSLPGQGLFRRPPAEPDVPAK